MDPLAAKFIGAGLACIGMGGAAIGVANVFGQFLVGALRNPSAAPLARTRTSSSASRSPRRSASSRC